MQTYIQSHVDYCSQLLGLIVNILCSENRFDYIVLDTDIENEHIDISLRKSNYLSNTVLPQCSYYTMNYQNCSDKLGVVSVWWFSLFVQRAPEIEEVNSL